MSVNWGDAALVGRLPRGCRVMSLPGVDALLGGEVEKPGDRPAGHIDRARGHQSRQQPASAGAQVRRPRVEHLPGRARAVHHPEQSPEHPRITGHRHLTARATDADAPRPAIDRRLALRQAKPDRNCFVHVHPGTECERGPGVERHRRWVRLERGCEPPGPALDEPAIVEHELDTQLVMQRDHGVHCVAPAGGAGPHRDAGDDTTAARPSPRHLGPRGVKLVLPGQPPAAGSGTSA